MRSFRSMFGAFLVVLALVTAACGSSSGGKSSSSAGGAKKGPVTIAAFDFGESKILANLYKDVLTKAGYQPTVKSLTNREVIEPALEKGEVDVVPEYVGTLTEFLNKKDNGPSARPLASGSLDNTLAALRQLAGKHNFTVLDPAKAADQNSFAVKKELADKNSLSTLSDLSRYTGRLVLGGPPECPTRPFCQPGLEKTYGLKFTDFKSLDAGGPLTKQALKTGTVDIGLVFSSDGSIDALGLTVLRDDKSLQTVDNVAPIVSSKFASDQALQKALSSVSAVLTTNDLITLNKQVVIDRADADKVASDYAKQKSLS